MELVNVLGKSDEGYVFARENKERKFLFATCATHARFLIFQKL